MIQIVNRWLWRTGKWSAQLNTQQTFDVDVRYNVTLPWTVTRSGEKSSRFRALARLKLAGYWPANCQQADGRRSITSATLRGCQFQPARLVFWRVKWRPRCLKKIFTARIHVPGGFTRIYGSLSCGGERGKWVLFIPANPRPIVVSTGVTVRNKKLLIKEIAARWAFWKSSKQSILLIALPRQIFPTRLTGRRCAPWPRWGEHPQFNKWPIDVTTANSTTAYKDDRLSLMLDTNIE